MLMCICPIPACRQPKTTLVFTSKAGGPPLPLLCSPEVLISFVFPQNDQGIKNVRLGHVESRSSHCEMTVDPSVLIKKLDLELCGGIIRNALHCGYILFV